MRYPFAVFSPDGGGGGGGGSGDPPPNGDKIEEVKEWLADLETLKTELLASIAAIPTGATSAELATLKAELTAALADLAEAKATLAELKKRPSQSKPPKSSKSGADDPPEAQTKSRRPSEWV